ncbi:MAG: phosphoribosylglycinamide formyltransferase, partial [Alphaproteobacteria bacterium]|nr:phosphoribosylglycinamide formyltransferase [Alphaproteobacteria bacterium]
MEIKNAAIFASGNGSNFENLVLGIIQKNIPIRIVCLITDQRLAGAIKRAQRLNIPHFIVPKYKTETASQFHEKILIILRQHQVEWIFLAGFMRILSAAFIEHFDHKILNIHPSLLPSFKGVRAIQQALNYGVKITGVTVHYVNAEVDGGEIITQEALYIQPMDTLETLTEK